MAPVLILYISFPNLPGLVGDRNERRKQGMDS